MILTPVLSLLLAGGIFAAAVWWKNHSSVPVDNTATIGKNDSSGKSDSSANNNTEKNTGKNPLLPDTGETEKNQNSQTDGKNSSGDTKQGDSSSSSATPKDSSTDDKGAVTLFADPVKEASLLHSFGFYYNPTLNSYYEHTGVDFSASEGAEVYAALNGTVSAIYKNDLLTGNSVEIEGEKGVKVIYYFLDPLETLKVGEKVYKGEIIGAVSAPVGNEYKDGAHLHLEVYENGTLTDPENYFSATQK